MDEACTPVDNPHFDMTFSVIKSIKTSSMILSAALILSNMQAQG
jgi:hypothetical protein